MKGVLAVTTLFINRNPGLQNETLMEKLLFISTQGKWRWAGREVGGQGRRGGGAGRAGASLMDSIGAETLPVWQPVGRNSLSATTRQRQGEHILSGGSGGRLDKKSRWRHHHAEKTKSKKKKLRYPQVGRREWWADGRQRGAHLCMLIHHAGSYPLRAWQISRLKSKADRRKHLIFIIFRVSLTGRKNKSDRLHGAGTWRWHKMNSFIWWHKY